MQKTNYHELVRFQTTEKGVNVVQLETASGAAIQSFEGAQGKKSIRQYSCIEHKEKSFSRY